MLSPDILKLKCTKFDFGWNSTPDPAESLERSPDPPAGFKGLTSKVEKKRGENVREGVKGIGVDGKDMVGAGFKGLTTRQEEKMGWKGICNRRERKGQREREGPKLPLNHDSSLPCYTTGR